MERLNAINNEENKILDNKVIKSTSGHGGTEVFLASDYPEAHFPKDVVVQPFVQGENADVRVYVLDNAIVSAVKRTAKEGFKSNYSLGGNVEEYTLSKEERVVVDKIIAWFNKERYLREKTEVPEKDRKSIKELADKLIHDYLDKCDYWKAETIEKQAIRSGLSLPLP